MFHPSRSTTRLISTLYKHAWPTITLLAFYVLASSFSYASQPDWVLSGTFLNAENAHAMFVDEYGNELLLELNDDIQGCDLVDVLRGSAKLQCSGKEYTLYLRNSVGDILQQAEYEKFLENKQTIILSKSGIADYIHDRQRLVSEIGFLPLVEDKHVVGYTLSKIQPDSKVASLGLYNGDVIKVVNGVPASDPEFLQTIQELSDELEVTVEVDRYGKSIAYTYVLK